VGTEKMSKDTYKENKSHNLSEEIQNLDREYLTFAKNSRDLIDKNLKIFKENLEAIEDNIQEEKDKKGSSIDNFDDYSFKLKEMKENFDIIVEQIKIGTNYLEKLKTEITRLEKKYTNNAIQFQNLEERLALTQESKKNLQEEYDELVNKKEALKSDLEQRQIDLMVLSEDVKDKLSQKRRLRTELDRFDNDINNNRDSIQNQEETIEINENKLKSLEAEIEANNVTIDKNRLEIKHSNRIIEAKEHELEVLNGHLKDKKDKLDALNEDIQAYKEGFPELEEQKRTYQEILEKSKNEMAEKQQKLINLENKLDNTKAQLNNLNNQLKNKMNLREVNEKRIQDLQIKIEDMKNQYEDWGYKADYMKEKWILAKKDFHELKARKNQIEESISESKELFKDMSQQLETQEKEIREKESRVHRLEVLGVIYRLSKFFGGILIGFASLLLIFSIGIFTRLFELGFENLICDLIALFLTFSSVLMLLSGLFHMEKS